MGNRAKKLLMLCVLLGICVVTGFLTCSGEADDGKKVNQLIAANKAESREQAGRTMKIYVSGAVMAPGIYDIPMSARAYDAVAAAGGMTEQADADRVNLAKKLKDGDHVNVPMVKKSSSRSRSTGAAKTNASVQGKGGAVTGNIQKGSAVNVNTASQSELEGLPGIGPAMAKRIIAEREKQPFQNVDDLLRVKGIGPAKLAKMRALVRTN